MSSECEPDTSEIGGNLFVCSCDGCTKSFRRIDRLKHHIAACHQGKNPFICTFKDCDKKYSNPSGLKRHINSVHSEKLKTKPKIRCTVENCDATFTCNTNLKKHLKRIHEGRQLKCSHCTKTFSKRQQLKIHEFQHTAIKPFKCSFEGCDKDFVLPSKLKAHMKCHNGYRCSSAGCDLTFTTWSLRQKHIKQSHDDDRERRCSSCDKMFANKKNLRNHMVTHGDSRKIFKCSMEGCGSFFYYEMNLRQHVKVKHEVGKKYECLHDDCNAEFKYKAALVKHSKLHISSSSLEDKTKRKRNCLKRRSTAARLARYKATREEEIAVMYPEKSSRQEEEAEAIPEVVSVSSELNLMTDPETRSVELETKSMQNDGNGAERGECFLTGYGNATEIRGIVCKVAS